MRRKTRVIALLIAALAAACLPAAADTLAPTPPMGWNSWDAYGLTISEADYKANVAVLASLRAHGWSYAVIDEGWYMANPFGEKRLERDYQLDGNGLLAPSLNRYPSAADGAGFKPLADWVHQQGLKFGFHIVRGIPKGAVERNTPIAGSGFHAAEAADTSDTCGWDDGNYGVRDNAAGQAYYDSMMRLYAQWGVDFVKVDCIADHPYKATEIRQIAEAVKKSGRPIVISLSPGPTKIEHGDEIARHAQLWRISNDIWDGWHFESAPQYDGFPSGVDTAFDNLAKWSRFVRPGNWPDADMLPIGSLKPHPGWGQPRQSRLTPDEARTQFALWAIGRSPLILGANLTMLDDATRKLITNGDTIAINQTATESHQLSALPPGFETARVWRAVAEANGKRTQYVAFFNLRDKPAVLEARWDQLELAGSHSASELWTGAIRPASDRISVSLPPHGCAVFRVE